MAGEIRGRECGPDTCMGGELTGRQKGEMCLVLPRVLREDIGGVGVIGSPPKNTQDPRIQSTCYYSSGLNRTDYVSHSTKNLGLQSLR